MKWNQEVTMEVKMIIPQQSFDLYQTTKCHVCTYTMLLDQCTLCGAVLCCGVRYSGVLCCLLQLKKR